MIPIGKTIVSEDLAEEAFVCDLSACKGACCVEGEAGAPLEKEEAAVLADIYDQLKPFLRPEGIRAIKKQGFFTKNPKGELETTLVEGRECAYTTFDKQGMAKCGIEEAWLAGAIPFRKPISCHLYPVRVAQFSVFAAVNYHRWPICNDACTLGKELKVPVYKFVKEALVRKFGQEWYDELEGAVNSKP